jgi:hypothetical protein
MVMESISKSVLLTLLGCSHSLAVTPVKHPYKKTFHVLWYVILTYKLAIHNESQMKLNCCSECIENCCDWQRKNLVIQTPEARVSWSPSLSWILLFFLSFFTFPLNFQQHAYLTQLHLLSILVEGISKNKELRFQVFMAASMKVIFSV